MRKHTGSNEETKSKWDCFSANHMTPEKIRRMRRIEQKNNRKHRDQEAMALREMMAHFVAPEVSDGQAS